MARGAKYVEISRQVSGIERENQMITLALVSPTIQLLADLVASLFHRRDYRDLHQ